MRVLGGVLIVFGLLFSLTVVGAIIGIPMMLIGLALVIGGRSNPTVVVQMNHHASQYPAQAQPHYPPQPQPPANMPGYSADPQALPLSDTPPDGVQPAPQTSPMSPPER